MAIVPRRNAESTTRCLRRWRHRRRGDPLRRTRHAPAGARARHPQAAGRDRRRADPRPRHAHLRCPRAAALLALHGLQGRADRGGGGRRDAGRPEIEVHCVDTGLDTPTGGRIARVGPLLEGRPFCATYADGVADIDLGRLMDFHREHGAAGDHDGGPSAAPVRGGRAERRRPRASASARSRAPSTGSTAASSASSRGASTTSATTRCSSASRSETLAAAGQLHAYRHEGFWDCMDTYKDAVLLDDLWSRGEAPWKVWGDA